MVKHRKSHRKMHHRVTHRKGARRGYHINYKRGRKRVHGIKCFHKKKGAVRKAKLMRKHGYKHVSVIKGCPRKR